MDLFKPEYKFYKRRVPPPDFSSVIDFSNAETFDKYDDVDVTHVINLHRVASEVYSAQFAKVGLRTPDTWKVHGLAQSPGLYFIRNPFLPEGQRSWIRRCLVDYPRRPNRTNIDATLAKMFLPNVEGRQDSLWNHHIQRMQNNEDGYRYIGCMTIRLLYKLRWVTLGYHHDWDTKVYNLSQQGDAIELPDEMQLLSTLLTSSVILEDDAARPFNVFNAQAAIVNFYDLNSSLSGHTDHSELDHSSPLLSISFGQTAIFLLGGPTKETKPHAMYLKSGDVVIMAGASRLSYHGIPRILPTADKPWTTAAANVYQDEPDDPDWKLLSQHIDKFRINMNIRQVLPTSA